MPRRRRFAEAAAQEIVLSAEKQAVFLKEAALSESQKRARSQEALKRRTTRLREIEMEKAELEKKLAALRNALRSLREKSRRRRWRRSNNGPKDYSVEVVEHNSASEVDTGKA